MTRERVRREPCLMKSFRTNLLPLRRSQKVQEPSVKISSSAVGNRLFAGMWYLVVDPSVIHVTGHLIEY